MKTIVALLIVMSLISSSFGSTQVPQANEEEKIVMLTILAEARGEGKDGMYAVACVIQQRVKEKRLSAAKVCRQRLQFSCWNNVTVVEVERQVSNTSTAIKQYAAHLARQVVQDGSSIDRSKVGFANHYCTTAINPKWSVGVKPVAVVKNHKFYRL